MANMNDNELMDLVAGSIGDNRQPVNSTTSSGNFFEQMAAWVQTSKDFIPRYWSRERDKRLRMFWKLNGTGHLASAMYNAQSKLAAIPVRIVARDPSITSHVQEAEEMTRALHYFSEWGTGFNAAMEKWFEDYLGQDNGAFLEVLGGPLDTDKSGPLRGRPVAIRHLDAARCQRTSDPIYPVLYTGEDGKKYAFHFSRVISSVQMPSSDSKLNGIGYSSVSRAIDFGQALMDLTMYKREKLGSKPARNLIIGKGIPGKQIMQAFRLADLHGDNFDNGSMYNRNIAIGSEDSSIDIKVQSLVTMDEFDEKTFVPYAMYGIALAFGIPADELWPEVADNSSNSALAHMRARGKLPAQVTSALEREFNAKFVPTHLQVKWDWVDDAQDKEQAMIRDIRARNRERNVYSRVTTYETERRIMLKDGDISRQDFIDMELEDGRLEDGAPVETLFYTTDDYLASLLALDGVSDPLDVYNNDPDQVLTAIQVARMRTMKELGINSAASKRKKAKMALAALKHLEKNYYVAEIEPQESSNNIDREQLGPRFRQRAAGTRVMDDAV